MCYTETKPYQEKLFTKILENISGEWGDCSLESKMLPSLVKKKDKCLLGWLMIVNVDHLVNFRVIKLHKDQVLNFISAIKHVNIIRHITPNWRTMPRIPKYDIM